MHIIEDVIDKELAELHREGVQLRHIGRLERLAPAIQAKVLAAIELTRNNSKLVLNVAFNYGGRDEIVNAIQRIVKDGVRPEDINADLIGQYLYTAGIPDPDLIIRTSGELRVSNFLIWQGAYSELYVTPVFWPDFDREEYRNALDTFSQRDRRYGCLSQMVEDDSNHAY